MSSVVEGFADYRNAAGEGIKQAGATPVMVNEQFPALDTTPRNACLDAVDSSDLIVVVVGERGGWTTPSGSTVVEEECERARSRKLPVLAFLKRAQRDSAAEELATKLSDYLAGRYRTEFDRPEELQRLVEAAVRPFAEGRVNPMPVDLSPYLRPRERGELSTFARLVVCPERQEEVITPMALESQELLRQVYEVGHSPEVGLLKYEDGKQSSINERCLVVVQRSQHADSARIIVGESGVVTVEAKVSNGLGDDDPTGTHGVTIVAAGRIAEVLKAGMVLGGRLYELRDRFGRHQRFYLNAGIYGLGFRVIERAPKVRSSYPTRMGADDAPIIAYEEPRIISRADLLAPEAEIDRLVTEFVRRGGA